MTADGSDNLVEPPLGWLVALGVFAAVALLIFWPMLTGQVLIGSDQIVVGYTLRQYAADAMRATGHIPQWNPFIFGGMPLWAIPGHMDIFYPTAWLRWFLSADTVLTLAFFIHYIVAGIGMYALLRTLRLTWAAALVGGVAYELSGILASQVSPGHDGKLYCSALAPFAFLALLRAIRLDKWSGYGWFALVIGLALLTPHYQAAYYLMIASALFTLWLVFLDPERRRDRSPVIPMALAILAVCVGVGVAMVEMLPVLHMVPYTPRAAGGGSGGWAYATSWAMPVEEIMTTILPQFNGMLQHYWGQNAVKDHTEYLGALVVTLAVLGIPVARRRGLLLAFGGIGVLFLLVAFGGHTPFYRLWYLLPRMNQFRAAGLAFFLVAMAVCVFAGLGVDQLLRGEVRTKPLYITLGVLGGIAVLAAAGLLQGVTAAIALPQRMSQVAANAPELQAGGLRLLLVILIGGAVLVMVQHRKIFGALAVVALVVVVAGDNWSILRAFPRWLPPAASLYPDDALTNAMKQTPMPFRVYDPSAPDAALMGVQDMAQLNTLQVYGGGGLMARGIPSLFGYQGMESRFFDALLGGKNVWSNQLSPTLRDLYAIKYFVLSQAPDSIPGFRKLLGPVQLNDPLGEDAPQAVLFERDSAPRWVRVVATAVKAPEAQIPATVADARFNDNGFIVFSDTMSVTGATAADSASASVSPVTATLKSWAAGAMTVDLAGTAPATTYLLVAENWYPDWHATVDGKPGVIHRADGALLSVELPAGARTVSLVYDIGTYRLGKKISILALLAVIGLLFADRMRPRAVDG